MIGPGGILYFPGGYVRFAGLPELLLSLPLWAWLLTDMLHRARQTRALRHAERRAECLAAREVRR